MLHGDKMQTARTQTQDIFFTRRDFSLAQAHKHIEQALGGCDDGDLFIEYHESERLVWDNGRLKDSARTAHYGFGLRGIRGDACALAYSSELSEAALRKASSHVASSLGHLSCGFDAMSLSPPAWRNDFYAGDNPLASMRFEDKMAVLEAIETYVRRKDERVCHVLATLTGDWQLVCVLRADGGYYADRRPLVRFNVQVTVKQAARQESGVYGAGGRSGYGDWLRQDSWQRIAEEALRQATINLEARAAPVGEMNVVLGPGWPGILLHEAIGHGLEGDFNRKKTSAFCELMGKRIAAKGITIVDDGTCPNHRGSLCMDDEGTPSQCTTLIEDGLLVGYMQDRLNGHLMQTGSTGNGRRESYAHQVMPRMTNTYMLAGEHDPAGLIESVDKGIYAAHFGGGQVDITSGKFVFSASLAYAIEKGKITYPLKGATLIGNGPDALTRISMVGNDLALDEGIGTCGKEGQMVPVGVGQPSLRIDGITVGGVAETG